VFVLAGPSSTFWRGCDALGITINHATNQDPRCTAILPRIRDRFLMKNHEISTLLPHATVGPVEDVQFSYQQSFRRDSGEM
jgi:hypothetical protein